MQIQSTIVHRSVYTDISTSIYRGGGISSTVHSWTSARYVLRQSIRVAGYLRDIFLSFFPGFKVLKNTRCIIDIDKLDVTKSPPSYTSLCGSEPCLWPFPGGPQLFVVGSGLDLLVWSNLNISDPALSSAARPRAVTILIHAHPLNVGTHLRDSLSCFADGIASSGLGIYVHHTVQSITKSTEEAHSRSSTSGRVGAGMRWEIG